MAGRIKAKGEESERGGPPAPMRYAVESFLRSSGLAQHMGDIKVYSAWRDVTGPDLCRRARAVAFRGGELVVEVESSPQLSELKGFTGETYRQEANRLLGSNRIRRVNYKLKR